MIRKVYEFSGNKYNNWTEEEEIFLKENYKNFKLEELSKFINRSKGAISIKSKRLNLFKKRTPWNKGIPRSDECKKKISIKNTKKRLTDNQIKFILDNYSTMTNRELSKIFNCSKDHIKYILKINKIIRTKEERKKLIKEKFSNENHPNFGKHISEQHKMTLRLSKLGKKLNKETIEKIKNNHLKEENIIKFKERRKKMITPKKDSSIEIKIQKFLKQLNIEFFTHQYMNIEHGYQCDILVPSMNLVIECDGDYFHGNTSIFNESNLNERQINQKIRDNLRTKELIEKGYKVFRIWENKIKLMNLNDFNKELMEIQK